MKELKKMMKFLLLLFCPSSIYCFFFLDSFSLRKNTSFGLSPQPSIQPISVTFRHIFPPSPLLLAVHVGDHAISMLVTQSAHGKDTHGLPLY